MGFKVCQDKINAKAEDKNGCDGQDEDHLFKSVASCIKF